LDGSQYKFKGYSDTTLDKKRSMVEAKNQCKTRARINIETAYKKLRK
jgi:hypothetical protein